MGAKGWHQKSGFGPASEALCNDVGGLVAQEELPERAPQPRFAVLPPQLPEQGPHVLLHSVAEFKIRCLFDTTRRFG